MSQFINETDIDFREVIRRGGANGGDEDFAFVRCPTCGYIYLIDYEIDTAFVDAADLTRRVGFSYDGDVIPCSGCGKPLLAGQIWAALRGDEGTIAWQVPREAFLASKWAWAAKNSDSDKTIA